MLLRYSRYAVPHALLVDVADTMGRYGRLRLLNAPGPRPGPARRATARCSRRCCARRRSRRWSVPGSTDETVAVHPSERGHLKQVLLKLGWPAEDLAGYVDGEAPPIGLVEDGWSMRPYQREAVDGFWAGGSGVVVLPCGAGKTIVGAAAMARAQATTLILVTNTVAARQWKHELLKRTTLTEEEIGEYSGQRKEIRPVTIATYQVHDDAPKGRLPAPRAVRRARLGPDRLRRGAPAAGADLPVHRGHPVPAPPRPDRDAGARGRPRGRRLLPHRPQAVRRALEGPLMFSAARSRRTRSWPCRSTPRDVSRPATPADPARSRPARRHRNGEVLEAELSARIGGEVRFDRTSRMLYSTDASNYQIEPVGVVIPEIDGRRARRDRAGRQPRRADPAARRRLVAGRADGRRGAGDRLLQIPEPDPRGRRRSEARSRVEPGINLDLLNKQLKAERADVRSRSLVRQPRHRRRRRRQQLAPVRTRSSTA